MGFPWERNCDELGPEITSIVYTTLKRKTLPATLSPSKPVLCRDVKEQTIDITNTDLFGDEEIGVYRCLGWPALLRAQTYLVCHLSCSEIPTHHCAVAHTRSTTFADSLERAQLKETGWEWSTGCVREEESTGDAQTGREKLQEELSSTT